MMVTYNNLKLMRELFKNYKDPIELAIYEAVTELMMYREADADETVAEIICRDTNEHSPRLIDAERLTDAVNDLHYECYSTLSAEIKNILQTYAMQYREDILRLINEQPTVKAGGQE